MNSMDPCAIVPLPRSADPAEVFASVAAQPALVRVVRSLLGPVAGARLVVATAPALAAAAADCLRSADLAAVAVTVTPEPGSRRQALVSGLEHLGVQADSSTTLVLVGDHRYPLSTGTAADLVLAGLRGGHDVVVPAPPVTDTVKTVDGVGSVLATVDRLALRTVQYPRGFTASVLWKLLSSKAIAPADDDEFTSALRAGLAIGTVDGDANAFQVELPRDAQLLDAIIACRPD